MTDDEQEALSFRYVAPRIFILSSGNIAIVPMVGRKPPVIVETKNFYDLVSYLPTMEELEAQHQAADLEQRTRVTVMNREARPKATLDDLA